MDSCLDLGPPELVIRHKLLPRYASNLKSAFDQVETKFPDVNLILPLYRGCIGADLWRLSTANYPACLSPPSNQAEMVTSPSRL